MEESKLRASIAANLTAFRKQFGYTQSDIAQRIHYSDKSVSKWERGDGIPDILVLAQLAELYQVSVDDLIRDHGETVDLPHPEGKRTQRYALLFTAGISLLLAAIAYFLFSVIAPDGGDWWLAFVYAMPVACIALTVLANLWHYSYRFLFFVSSGILWGVAVSLHLTFRHTINFGWIYLVAAIFQIVWALWHKMLALWQKIMLRRERKKQ